MSIKISSRKSLLVILIAAAVTLALAAALTYGWARERQAGGQVAPLPSERECDGLLGPVSKVRTETARIIMKSGEMSEGPRELVELTTYDPSGRAAERSYYLVPSDTRPGREEYSYGERGNITETTVRDRSGAILGRETYTYEYDAIGNWTRMVTSRVLFEGGKLNQQPAEVTYRTISYYFDQAISQIVNPTLSSGRNAGKESAALLRNALDDWIAATNQRDLEKLMSFYDERVDVFYLARNVSRASVRAEKARLFERAFSIDIRAGAPEITLNADEHLATMRFRKPYVIRERTRVRQGEVLQQLRWQQTAEGWKIIGERDAEVIR